MRVSVILPCRNEEQTIGICIEKIQNALKGKDYEIIVSDSSSDKSPAIAKKYGVKVIKHNLEGYGNAILQGIKSAKGDFIIIGDADNTYDFFEIPKFIEQLNKGYDLVIGSRFKGNVEDGAMPFSHKYFGTPVLNFLIRLFFKIKISDINSGFRGIKREALENLNLNSSGMEFASEMLIKTARKKLKIKEIPINYSKRIGSSKLRKFNDGWRHLRFMLLYSPNFTFLFPGLLFILLGFLIMGLVLAGKLVLFSIHFQTHPMFVGSILVILGYQLILTWIFTKIYSHNHLNEENKSLDKLFKFFNLEKAVLAGIIFFLIGILIYLDILVIWFATNFGALNTINISIFALTFVVLGIQTIFSGFFFSILGIQKTTSISGIKEK